MDLQSCNRKQKSFLRVSGFVVVVLLVAVWIFSFRITPTQAASATITPAGTWNDNTGSLIQAHGGGIIKVGSVYYWVGEDRTGESAANANFQNIKCYSSTDLAHWTFVSNVLTRQASGELGPNRLVERPKVIYNSTTRQYVMYMHIDVPNYSAARVGVATSSSVCGSYSYRGSFQPLGFQSRDMSLFKDDDGTAYLLSEDRVNGLRIDKLSADYLSVVSAVAVLADREGPGMFRFNGRYYLFASHLTGWSTNDNQYTTATSLAGPWSAWSTFAPTDSKTFNSQTNFLLPIAGSQGTTFIYMGDRWISTSLGTSPYVWLPLQVNGANVSMSWHNSWSIDIATGIWQDVGATVYNIVNHRSRLLMDVSGASSSPGANVIQWNSDGGANQQWSLVAIGGGYYHIVNKKSGLLLDVSGGSTSAGAKIVQENNTGSTSQQWKLVAVNLGFYHIVNRKSGLFLDVSGGSTSAGASVVQGNSTSSFTQQWILE